MNSLNSIKEKENLKYHIKPLCIQKKRTRIMPTKHNFSELKAIANNAKIRSSLNISTYVYGNPLWILFHQENLQCSILSFLSKQVT